MPPSRSDIEQQLTALRRDYALGLPAKIAELRDLWTTARRGGDPDAMASLHRLTHSLAGAGASFGYPEISDAARALESLLRTLRERDRDADPEEIQRVEQTLARLAELAAAAKQRPRA